jgi:hypothetical protein
MIWLLFAAAAGVATWAALATRSGAIDRKRGGPLTWGAGVTAAVLLVLLIYEIVQQERMMAQFTAGRDHLDRQFAPASEN